jgi:hypothetical protein
VGLLCVLFLLIMPEPDLSDQLENMFFAPGHFVQENNFVVNGLNIFGFCLLIVSRLVYIITTSETQLDAITKLAVARPPAPAAKDGDGLESSLIPPHEARANNHDRTPWSDLCRRCSSRARDWEDPYRAAWFMKAPDLMIRVCVRVRRASC